MTDPVLAALDGLVDMLVDTLGGGGDLPPATPDALLVVVEDDAATLDPTDLAPLASGLVRVRLVSPAALVEALTEQGWTVSCLRPVQGRLAAVAHGPTGSPWAGLAAALETERAAAIARAELVDGILVTLGGEYAVEHAARAAAAETVAAAATAELAATALVRDNLQVLADAQAAEIARLVGETYLLKQRLVGPDGAVSPRVAAALGQSRRVGRALRRRLASS